MANTSFLGGVVSSLREHMKSLGEDRSFWETLGFGQTLEANSCWQLVERRLLLEPAHNELDIQPGIVVARIALSKANSF